MYGSWQSPRPPTSYWNALLFYLLLRLSLNFLFRSPIFCLQLSPNQLYVYPSFQPYCPDGKEGETNEIKIVIQYLILTTTTISII